MRVAVTGATGAVGEAVVAALEGRGDQVFPIGRRAPTRWDMREPLPDAVRALLEEVDAVVHSAADIRLGARPELLRRVNTEATEELVAAAAAASSRPRMVYMSSAFAAPGGSEHNPYELSKMAAEEAIQQGDLDFVILRPSIVIGASDDGSIARFGGVYAALRLLVHGLFPAIPADPTALVDIVPVDLVAAVALTALGGRRSRGRVINVTGGDSSPNVQWLFETACDVIESESGISPTRPRFVSPESYWRLFRPLILPELSGAQRVVLETVELFLPYLARTHSFQSALDPDPETLREAWRKSVAYWIRRSRARPLGFATWTPRMRDLSRD